METVHIRTARCITALPQEKTEPGDQDMQAHASLFPVIAPTTTAKRVQTDRQTEGLTASGEGDVPVERVLSYPRGIAGAVRQLEYPPNPHAPRSPLSMAP